MSLLVEGRFTHDIDATVLPSTADLPDLFVKLAEYAFSPRVSYALEFARSRLILLLVHDKTKIPIDLGLGYTGFEHDMIQRAQELVVDGVKIRFPTPEDIVITKSVYPRLQDLADIDAIRRTYPSLDREHIYHVLEQFAEALDDPDVAKPVKEVLNRPYMP